MIKNRRLSAASVGALTLSVLFSNCSPGAGDKTPSSAVLKGTLKQTIAGDMENVRAVAFSADSKTLVSGSLGFVVKVWDAQSGAEKLTIKDVSPPLAVSPDGKTMAAVDSTNNSVKLVDIQSGAIKQTLTGHTGEITSVAFSGDGNSICTGSFDKSIKVWDARSGALKNTLSGHTDTVLSVALSPDAKTAASGSRDETLKLWNVQSGAVEQTIKLDGVVDGVTFNRKGDTGACVVFPKTIKIWDAHTGADKQTITGDDTLTSLSFSPDGKLLAGGSYDNSVRVWDAATGEAKMNLKGHTDVVESVAFSPDGKLLASGSADKTVKLWE
jgi:WD40 repeat protein